MGTYLWSITWKILCRVGVRVTPGGNCPFQYFQWSGDSSGAHKIIQVWVEPHLYGFITTSWPTPDDCLINAHLSQAQHACNGNWPCFLGLRKGDWVSWKLPWRELLCLSDLSMLAWSLYLYVIFLSCPRNCASQLWVGPTPWRCSKVDTLVFCLWPAPST